MHSKSLLTTPRLAARAALFSLGGLATLSGCGGNPTPTYPAGGHVRFSDGTPLDEGWVEFEPLAGDSPVSARGQIQPDGSFQLSTFEPGDGAVAGEHRAVVVILLSEAAALNPAAHPRRIAPRFSDYDQSGLRFQIQTDAKQNRFEILVAPPGQ